MAGETEGDLESHRDAVYRVTPNREVEQIASGDGLHRTDGIWVRDGEVWITAFGSKEVYRPKNDAKTNIQQLPNGS